MPLLGVGLIWARITSGKQVVVLRRGYLGVFDQVVI
jgi:hypothetical protein